MNAPAGTDRTPWNRTASVSPSGVVPAGLGLIIVGLVLLADNLGWLDAGALLRGWWPAAIVVAGVWWLVTGARWLGVTVTLVGALLLINTLALTDVAVGSLVFPALLVVLGSALLDAGRRVRSARGTDGGPLRFPSVHPRPGDPGWAAGDLAATAVFGDARLVVGDGDRDLELDRVTVAALSVFGEVKIDVPAGWRVEDHTTTVFGDTKIPRDQPTYAEAPVVELHGLVLFGDAKVRYLDAPEGGR
jgi:hypothetical protein